MLSCLAENIYAEAKKGLDRSLDFRCPVCLESLILRAGSRNLAHFSHKPGANCAHGIGETPWHRKGKHLVACVARRNGCTARFEAPVGDRRTDVLVSTQKQKIAIEFQKKDQGADLYKRTKDLLLHVDKVIWVFPWKVKPVDQFNSGRLSYRAIATYGVNALYSDKKKPAGAEIRFYDDKNDALYVCKKFPWYLWVEETEFGGGFHRASKRWCELFIVKTFQADIEND